MRVTANTFPDSLVNQLSSLSRRQYQLQHQAASGQRVTRAEDDPVAMRRVIDLQGENSAIAQYQRNIARHQELGTATFSALKSLKSISDRARELAIGADSIKAPEELRIYAKEITELIKTAAQIGNTKTHGDYLFSGTFTDQMPFTVTTDAAGVVTDVVYQGNTTLPESEIASGVTLTAQIAGENISGIGPRGLFADDRVGADFFQHLIDLQDHLIAGDSEAIATTDRAALGRDEDNFLYHVGANGAIQSRLGATLDQSDERLDTLERLVSQEVDADLTETILRLTQTQTAYQAALQSAGRILGSSLLDYIR